MVGQVLDDVGYRNLHDDVHTALKVEAKADLHFLALLEGVSAEPYFLVLERVEVVLPGYGTHGCGLVFIVSGDE